MEQITLCPRVEKGIQILSKRWAILVIYRLLSGPQRFCTIEAALPISGRLLSERLKELEQEGIVNRKVYPETPVRIEYSLTEKGRALEPVVREIESWSSAWVLPEEKVEA
ncbi:winged helix-turn-helix transcriptional regulator [Paenibacillus abyssi]|uniref:MarR family transcriptional regulator n=1 Tax=Paenibacillus abyssi TaxID=1340531 RepID=A0A917D482_9BACL|nr:winged helix-turn-helix transcriptional regulator [Paenibacillus abyssi]GGG09601.1 MarR family transcriptional regulator [Paenibacillus abyssi]